MTFVKFKNSYPERTLNRMLNPLFSDVFNELFHSEGGRAHALPAVNISENTEAFIVELAAPGLTKEDFKINLEKDILSISTEKKVEKTEQDVQYTRKEFGFHSFKRSFTLPENADKTSISAEYKEGVLILTVAKLKELKEDIKEIQVR